MIVSYACIIYKDADFWPQKLPGGHSMPRGSVCPAFAGSRLLLTQIFSARSLHVS